MLPAASRLRQRSDFTQAVRQGVRAGRPRLVVHFMPDDAAVAPGHLDAAQTLARVGFVVPRSVGSAVMRNRVRRQLRHVALARLQELPVGSRLVVRVLPAAGGSTSAELAGDFDTALRRVIGREVRRDG